MSCPLPVHPSHVIFHLICATIYHPTINPQMTNCFYPIHFAPFSQTSKLHEFRKNFDSNLLTTCPSSTALRQYIMTVVLEPFLTGNSNFKISASRLKPKITAISGMDLEKRAKFFTKLSTHLFITTAKEIQDLSFKESSAEGLSGQWSKAIEIFCDASGATVGAGVGFTIAGPVGIVAGARCGKMTAGILNNIVQSGISGILQVG